MATRRHYTDEELALIEETRKRLGFHVVPEDPEWPIPDPEPQEGDVIRWLGTDTRSVFRNGKWEQEHGWTVTTEG